MSTVSFKTSMDITRELISTDEYVTLLSDSLSVIALLYKPVEKKLCYNTGELLNILGYPRNQNNDTYDVFDLIHPNDAAILTGVLATLDRNENHPEGFHCRFLQNDGNYKPYNFQCKIYAAGNDRKVIILGFNAQKATYSSSSTDKAINDLKLINRELEDFAYAASHDLQEPLRKIITFSTRLAEKCKENLEDDGNMYLDRIMASANNMRLFIDNLLEFSRLSRDTTAITNTDLNFICQQAKADFDLAIEETKAHIIIDRLPIIQASSTQMKQLFTNIINNAIKFRKDDVQPAVRINSAKMSSDEIRKYDLLHDQVYYKISIADNGIGFDEEYANRIFKIFQRLHGKSEYPGSGIGLAICKKIIDQHKGRIFATSVKGEGTTFTIILPEKQQN